MTREWFLKVCQHALADTETSEATYDISRMILERGIPGDFVECGVYAGAQAALMARALMDKHSDYDYGSRVHLFDTFSGIPVAGPEDHELQGKPAGISACSLNAVKMNMQRWGIDHELLVYHEGLFEHTVPSANISQIAFLRLDGDLYRSTKPCMEHLYPKVVRGGWMVVDDFNLSGCRQAVMEHVVPAPIYWRVPTK